MMNFLSLKVIHANHTHIRHMARLANASKRQTVPMHSMCRIYVKANRLTSNVVSRACQLVKLSQKY